MKNIIKKHRALWLLTIFVGILLKAANIGVAYILASIIDTITKGTAKDLKSIGIYAVVILVSIVILGILYSYLGGKFSEKILTDTKEKFFKNIFTSPIYRFQEKKVSYYYNTLTQDLEQVNTNYLSLTYEIIVCLGGLIVSLAALFYINIKMSLLFLAMMFIVSLVPKLFVGIQTRAAENFSNEYESYVEELDNILSGFESIKLLNITKALYNKILSKDAKMENARMNKKLADYGTLYAISGISFLSHIGCMMIGAIFTMKGEITTGMLIAAVQILNFVFSPISEIAQYRNLMKSNKVIRDKLEPFLVDIDEKGTEMTKGEIILKDYGISFDDKEVLKDLNFKFEPNKSYAIIGPSGSGKSVLAKSLAGYYENYLGDIYYNGIEKRDIKPSSFNEHVRYIGTNSFILNDNIKENIRMYRDIPESEIRRVSKLVGFDDTFIEKESLGNEGKYISSGEYQRIAIARALLDNPYCLILDEPTANLDPVNVEGITKLIADIEVPIKIVITHHYTDEYLNSFDEVIDFNKLK